MSNEYLTKLQAKVKAAEDAIAMREVDLSSCLGVEEPETHDIEILGFAVRRNLFSLGWQNQLVENGSVLFESSHLALVIDKAKELRKERELNS